MMKTMKVMLWVVLVMTMGCKSKEIAVLAGPEWELKGMTQGSEVIPVPAEAPTVSFTDSASVYGFAGCNRFFGQYTTEGKEAISLKLGGMTMMFCPEMPFEGQFTKALEKVTVYRVTPQELQLTDAEKTVTLVFAPKDTSKLIGVANDSHGCNAAAGFTWSEVQQRCVRLFESGVRMNSVTDTTATSSAFIVFSSDSSKVELFLPTKEVHSVLEKRTLPGDGFAWNVEDDDTMNVRKVDNKWVIEQRGNLLFSEN